MMQWPFKTTIKFVSGDRQKRLQYVVAADSAAAAKAELERRLLGQEVFGYQIETVVAATGSGPFIQSGLKSIAAAFCSKSRSAKLLVIGEKKPHRVVNKRLLVFHTPLRHLHNALGNYFAHDLGICRAGELTARLLDPTPSFIESRCKHVNSLRIERRFRRFEI
jgi:hypothetical protein